MDLRRKIDLADVTRKPSAIEKGDANAAEQLLPLVYEELRRLAAQKPVASGCGRSTGWRRRLSLGVGPGLAVPTTVKIVDRTIFFARRLPPFFALIGEGSCLSTGKQP